MKNSKRTNEEEPISTEAGLRNYANRLKTTRNIILGVGVLALASGITWEVANGNQENRHNRQLATATTVQEFDKATSFSQEVTDAAPTGLMLIGGTAIIAAGAAEAMRRETLDQADEAQFNEAITTGKAFI